MQFVFLKLLQIPWIYFCVITWTLQKPHWRRSFLLMCLFGDVNSCTNPFHMLANFGRIFFQAADWFFKENVKQTSSSFIIVYKGKLKWEIFYSWMKYLYEKYCLNYANIPYSEHKMTIASGSCEHNKFLKIKL